MQYKALNRVLLINKALRVYKKKTGEDLTELSILILYSIAILSGEGKSVTTTNILLFFKKQGLFPEYSMICKWVDYFIDIKVLLLNKDKKPGRHFYISSYGISLLQSFELCLRRCRHDR